MIFSIMVTRFFYLIGYMGYNLNGLAQVITPSLFVQYGLVNPAGGYISILGQVFIYKSFIMTKSKSVSAPSSVTYTSPC
jgi:membrane-bound ClpP family serine protease